MRRSLSRFLLHVALPSAAVLAAGCGASDTPAALAAARPLATAQDTTLFAVGYGLASQFNLRGLFTADELALIHRGFDDAVVGDAEFDLSTHLEGMNGLISERRQARGARLQQEGNEFVAQAAAQSGAVTTASGLVYLEQRAGTGPSPAATDSVTVHYEGSFSDGTVFDSSIRRGQPVGFRLGAVIPGWREGLQLMKEGGKAKLVIPSALGYGERGHPPAIPPNVPLVFAVELIDVHGSKETR